MMLDWLAVGPSPRGPPVRGRKRVGLEDSARPLTANEAIRGTIPERLLALAAPTKRRILSCHWHPSTVRLQCLRQQLKPIMMIGFDTSPRKDQPWCYPVSKRVPIPFAAISPVAVGRSPRAGWCCSRCLWWAWQRGRISQAAVIVRRLPHLRPTRRRHRRRWRRCCRVPRRQ